MDFGDHGYNDEESLFGIGVCLLDFFHHLWDGH